MFQYDVTGHVSSSASVLVRHIAVSAFYLYVTILALNSIKVIPAF